MIKKIKKKLNKLYGHGYTGYKNLFIGILS